jgi:hypothetical protein
MNYQTTLLGWHEFYSITGMAAASLVGLLFVGLALHLRLVVSHPDVQGLARVTPTSFGLTLVVSLFMVIPESDSSATGWQLIGSGVGACLLIAPSLISGARSRARTIGFRRLLMRFGLTTLGFLGVTASGGLFVAGAYRSGLGWLVGVAVVLLLVSLRNTWDLLVSVGAATLAARGSSGT